MLYIPKEQEKKELEKVFCTGSYLEIRGALLDMGFHMDDFEFAIKWISIMMERKNEIIRGSALYSLSYFCMFGKTVPDPNKVLDVLVKGLLDVNGPCSAVAQNAQRDIVTGREDEQKRFRIKCIFNVFDVVSANLIIQKKQKKWLGKRVAFQYKVEIKKMKRLVDASLQIEKLNQSRERDISYLQYNLRDYHYVKYDFFSLDLDETINQYDIFLTLKNIIGLSWYENDYEYFIKVMKQCIYHPEGIIRYHTILALYEYLSVRTRCYELSEIFDILNEFIECDESVYSSFINQSDKINGLINEEYCKSFAFLHPEMYSKENLNALAQERLQWIKQGIDYWTVGYYEDDDE